MEITKRMSLNSSLKDANIFADTSSDDSNGIENIPKNIKIKKEPVDETTPESIMMYPTEKKVKQEKIKQEMDTPKSSTNFTPLNIKQEDFKVEDGGSIAFNLSEMVLKTPIKDEDSPRSSLKITTRSLLKQRNSPYMKEKETVYEVKKMRRRIGGDEDGDADDNKTGRKAYSKAAKKTVEADPDVLARRQKQIDFGKNTIGYDNYTKQVPRHKRKPEDPATPNKYRMYSRRGFDGLVKQWRLKLHQYDDPQ